VKFKSVTESYLDSGNDLVSHILLGVLAHFARLDATKISSRTEAGLARVRAQGKTLGRPDKLERHGPTLQRLRAEGLSVRHIASKTGLSKNTLQSTSPNLESRRLDLCKLCAAL
jgi:putative DNA-invertase from lambdoid prophage Rac